MDGKLLPERAPLFEELERYANQALISYHTPGHKAGLGLEARWTELKFPANFDLTEISAFNWAGTLAAAERLAAEFYRADHTFFLIQGASQGVIGGILGAFSPGDTVFVGRNCHSSVIKGIMLAGLNPVYIEVDFLPEFNLPVGINSDSLRRRVKECPDFKGLIVTSPSYQGIARQLEIFREIIGNRILLVDEAHGGHLTWTGFAGYDAYHYADIWVQGSHKILGSLTQTGLLHLKNRRIDPLRVKTNLDLITTTSPSYILLASLDSNRRWLALNGARRFREKLPAIQAFKDRVARLRGLNVLTDENLPGLNLIVDPWKLSVQFCEIGLTGYEVETILQEKYRIQPEYADLAQVTFFAAPWQAEPELDQLELALTEISVDYTRPKSTRSLLYGDFPEFIPQLVMSPRDAGLGPGELVPLTQAVGRISAAIIAPYPPGIPLIAPGELIGAAGLEYIQAILRHRGMVRGVNDDGTIRVTRE